MRAFVHACGCSSGPCGHAPDGDVYGQTWSACPFGETRDPMWRAAVTLGALADVSPLTGLDVAWSAGVAWALVELRAAQAEMRAQRQAEEVEAMRRRGGG